MTSLAAYLLLFVAVGVGFILVHLVAGKLIRPNKPDEAKRTIYECGEPTIGSAWIQFDLRFYVVALLFVIFDVEVAFFFPWAVVFGKVNALANTPPPSSTASYQELTQRTWELVPPASRTEQHDIQRQHLLEGKPADSVRLQELRALRQNSSGKLPKAESNEVDRLESNERIIRETRHQARVYSWLSLLEIAVFFGVLLVGYAYLWRRGDLAWVRSLSAERSSGGSLPSSAMPTRQPTPASRAETVLHS